MSNGCDWHSLASRMERSEMCKTCDRKTSAAGISLSSQRGTCRGDARRRTDPARAADGAPTSLSPDEALAALKEGNARYVSHPELCSIDLAAERASVAGHQAPWATVIACADSRVPPELIFGGHGDRPAFRRPQRRQPCRHGYARHGRIRRGGAWVAAYRRPRPYKLRSR